MKTSNTPPTLEHISKHFQETSEHPGPLDKQTKTQEKNKKRHWTPCPTLACSTLFDQVHLGQASFCSCLWTSDPTWGQGAQKPVTDFDSSCSVALLWPTLRAFLCGRLWPAFEGPAECLFPFPALHQISRFVFPHLGSLTVNRGGLSAGHTATLLSPKCMFGLLWGHLGLSSSASRRPEKPKHALVVSRPTRFQEKNPGAQTKADSGLSHAGPSSTLDRHHPPLPGSLPPLQDPPPLADPPPRSLLLPTWPKNEMVNVRLTTENQRPVQSRTRQSSAGPKKNQGLAKKKKKLANVGGRPHREKRKGFFWKFPTHYDKDMTRHSRTGFNSTTAQHLTRTT